MVTGPSAVILAGGRGTRLRPLTTLIPKPLVPIGSRHSILDIAIAQLAAAGFSHIWIAVGHLSHLIRATIGDGCRWGVDITYIEENEPLGTAGPLTGIDDLPEHFLVMNGDVLCDVDPAELVREHAASRASLTVTAVEREVRHDYGVLSLDDGAVRAFDEKPVEHFYVSAGIYVVDRALIRRYPRNEAVGFDSLIRDRIDASDPPAVHVHGGIWFDVGRPGDYDEVNADAEGLIAKLLRRVP